MKIMNRILILAMFFSSFAFSMSSIAYAESKPKLAIGNVSFGPEAQSLISLDKIESALYLANGVGQKYEFIASAVRDSIMMAIKTKNPNFKPEEFVQELGADRMYFFQIDVLANMLRVHLNALNPKARLSRNRIYSENILSRRSIAVLDAVFFPAAFFLI